MKKTLKSHAKIRGVEIFKSPKGYFYIQHLGGFKLVSMKDIATYDGWIDDIDSQKAYKDFVLSNNSKTSETKARNDTTVM